MEANPESAYGFRATQSFKAVGMALVWWMLLWRDDSVDSHNHCVSQVDEIRTLGFCRQNHSFWTFIEVTLLLWAKGAAHNEHRIYILERVKSTFRLISLMLAYESVAKAVLLGIVEDKKRAKKIATFMREHGQSVGHPVSIWCHSIPQISPSFCLITSICVCWVHLYLLLRTYVCIYICMIAGMCMCEQVCVCRSLIECMDG